MSTEIEAKIQKALAFIRKEREAKGYSQEYVAYRMGITQSAYQKMESGRFSMKLIHFLSICHVLESNLSEIEDFSF